jgi:hypothetical protein
MPDELPQNEWTADPDATLRRFLDEMGTSTHIMQQGFTTMILTKLRREELVDYLVRLAEAVSHDMQNRDDLVHVVVEDLGNGESRTAAILIEEVA